MKEELIPRDWLVERLTTNNLLMALDADLRALGFSASATVQFMKRITEGPHWRRFVEAKQDDDEVWRFRSPLESGPGRSGHAGFALLRNDEIVNVVTTIRG